MTPVDDYAATNPWVWIGVVPYDAETKAWLQATDHYLGNAPPGALFAVGVRERRDVLFPDCPVAVGPLLGLCLLSRPIARMLPQDGSVAEVTRLWLDPSLPYGTASAVLRHAASVAKSRGVRSIISYHDRTRHSGCIYRKAGFRKDGIVTGSTTGWASRKRSASACEAGKTSKRRWRLDL
jgi:hypothetical protein